MSARRGTWPRIRDPAPCEIPAPAPNRPQVALPGGIVYGMARRGGRWMPGDRGNNAAISTQEGGTTMKRLLTATLVALAFVSAPVLAQEQPVYTWINLVKAKPGQGDALVKLILEEDAKTFDPLVASGAALAWGVGMPIVHDGKDPYSHVEWIDFAGWAGADAFMKLFMEQRQAMGEAGSKEMNAKWDAVVEPGSHADIIVRRAHTGAGGPGRVGYISLGYYRAKPGKMGDLKKMYMSNVVPVMDKVLADGKIVNYGLNEVAVHRGQEWDYMSWYVSEGLAARDAVDAAFDAADAARSEAENKAMGEKWSELIDPSGHSDQIMMVIHFKGPGTSQDFTRFMSGS
jgi:hypothetical protein